MQTLINEKNWEALEKEPILPAFNYAARGFKSLVFERDFITDFMVNHFITAKENSQGAAIWSEDVISNLFLRAAELGITFSADEWPDLITALAKTLAPLQSAPARAILSTAHKGKSYLEAFANKEFVDAYSSIIEDAGLGRRKWTAAIKKEDYDALGDSAKTVFPNVLSLIKVQESALRKIDLTKLFTIDEIVKMAVKYDLTLNAVLCELDSEEYGQTMMKYFRHAEDGNLPHFTSWLNYWPNDNTQLISDELLEFFKENIGVLNAQIFKIVANNLTLEQAEKYQGHLTKIALSSNPRIPLQFIADFPGANKHIGSNRFLTEEEILKYPELMSPMMLKQDSCAYVTKKTFSVINKAWGTRLHHSPKLINFNDIVTSAGVNGTLDSRVLRYLKSKFPDKTDADVLEVVKTVGVFHDAVIIKQMQAFLTKYGE